MTAKIIAIGDTTSRLFAYPKTETEQRQRQEAVRRSVLDAVGILQAGLAQGGPDQLVEAIFAADDKLSIARRIVLVASIA